MDKWKPLVGGDYGIVIVIAFFAVASFFAGRMTARNGAETAIVERADTLVIRDTIKVTEAVSVTRRVVDSVPYPVTDTIRMRDTLYVLLERQQVTWEDSLSRVYASGINPQVDSVIHFIQERVITRHIPIIQVRKTRWGVGIQAGATADKNGVIPYVGVGVSYNILTW